MTSLTHRLQIRFKRPIRFVIVGVLNSLVGLAIIYGCKYFLGMGDMAANIVGYAVGLTVSFVLNSAWTFEYRGPKLAAAGRFLGVFAISYVVNLATVMGLIHLAGVNSYLAQAAGMPVYTICFYLLSRAYAFRQPA
jgi:putative flippase GtrA